MRCTCDAREEELHTTLFSVQSPTVLRLRRHHAHLVHHENVCDCRKVFTYTNLNFSFYFHILYSDVGVDVVLVAAVVVVAVFLVLLLLLYIIHT